MTPQSVWDIERNDIAACVDFHDVHGARPDDIRTMVMLQDDPTELLQIIAGWAPQAAVSTPAYSEESDVAPTEEFDVGQLEADMDALASEIIAEWEAESRDDQIGAPHGSGHGYNPNRAGNGQFGSGPHHDRKTTRAERAEGHAHKAEWQLNAIAEKRQVAETKHATSKTKAAASMKEAKAAKALAKKEPTAENVAAWHTSTKQAIRDRTAAEKHGTAAQRHADLHDKAETTHAIAQAKLKEAQRAASAAPAPIAPARELHGIGFDRVHGEGAGGEAVSPTHAPAGQRQHVTEAAAAEHARAKGSEIDSEVTARAKAAEAVSAAAEKAASRGTTSLWKPTSVAEEEQRYRDRVSQGSKPHDPRKGGESWPDYNVRISNEHQASAARMHREAQDNRAPLPRAAETIGFSSLPGKKRRDEADDLAENARALVAVAKEYPSEASISAAREAVELARQARQGDE